MVIGIDANEANVTQKVGTGQYAFELIKHLYILQDIKKEKIKFILYLKSTPSDKFPEENNYWEYKVLPGRGFWILTSLMPRLLKSDHYLPIISRVPQVCMIHDLGYLKFSEQFNLKDYWQLKYWSAISISISKYIISPSKSTKNDIVRHYKNASKKVKVIPHGYNKKLFNENINNLIVRQIKNKYRISENYLLFLSTLKPSKNIEGLINTFSVISKKYPKYNLVIAGKKGWMYETIFKKVEELGLSGKVIFTGYVKEEEKPFLFAGAMAFVLPSFWEGFGMDILNSMACKTPVLASNTASIPEVAGKAAIYFDPNKTDSMVNAISKIIEMPVGEYNKLVKLGQERVKSYSWEKCASKTYEVLKLAGEKN